MGRLSERAALLELDEIVRPSRLQERALEFQAQAAARPEQAAGIEAPTGKPWAIKFSDRQRAVWSYSDRRFAEPRHYAAPEGGLAPIFRDEYFNELSYDQQKAFLGTRVEGYPELSDRAKRRVYTAGQDWHKQHAASIAKARKAGQPILASDRPPPEFEAPRSIPGTAIAGLKRGIYGSVAGLLSTNRALANRIAPFDPYLGPTATAPSWTDPEYWRDAAATSEATRPKGRERLPMTLAERIRDPRWWVGGVMEALPQMVGAAGAYAVGGPAASFGIMAALEGGGAYEQALAAGDSEATAAAKGLGVGIVNGALEMLPIDALVGRLGQRAVKGATRRAGSRLGRFLTNTVQQGIIEGVTEGTQERVSQLVGELGHTEAPDERQQREDVIASMLLGAAAGGLFGGGAAIVTSPPSINQHSRTVDERLPPLEAIPADAKSAIAPEQRQREPDKKAQGIQAVFATAKNAVTDTFIDAAWQSAQSGRPMGGARPGFAEQMVNRAASQGLVQSRADVERLVSVATSVTTPQQAKTVYQTFAAGRKTEVPGAPVMELTDGWLADRQEAEVRADIRAYKHRDSLKALVGSRWYNKAARAMSLAMQVYIDLKNAPNDVDLFWQELTPEQQNVVLQAQNLPEGVRALADQIADENAAIGTEAKDAGVIQNVRENYTARIWDMSDKAWKALQGKLTTTTARAKPRTLSSVLEGWARGLELRVPGAIEAQLVASQQVSNVIHDRNMIETGVKQGTFSTRQEYGANTARLNHPNFQKWVHRGTVGDVGLEADAVHGRNFFVTEEGAAFERVPLYAPAKLAAKLNNITGTSALYGIPGVKTLTKYNAAIKQAILFTSFFHHQAYALSYMLAGRGLNPVAGYRAGKAAATAFTPEFRDLVRGGLTWGRIQDYEASMLRDRFAIGKAIDRIPGVRNARDFLLNLRDRQSEFLFGRLGPYLKGQAALLEYRAQLEKNAGKLERGETTRHDIAKAVASLLNDDFGGLNLQRMGRNPTTQHIFRLLALAPDWTESNIHMARKGFHAGLEGQVARAMWARVLMRGVGLTILSNLMLSAGDDDSVWKNYSKAWKAGRLRWLDVDVTPVYRALGGKAGKRKYFGLIGHFRDPVKFAVHPIRSAKHKSSVVGRTVLDMLSGSDWADRPFTTWSELLGVDDKGVYKTNVFGEHLAGDPKGGKLRGRLVTTPYRPSGPLELGQAPSFLLHAARSSMPIQMQQMMAFMAGEVDAFDAITRSAGLRTATTYED